MNSSLAITYPDLAPRNTGALVLKVIVKFWKFSKTLASGIFALLFVPTTQQEFFERERDKARMFMRPM